MTTAPATDAVHTLVQVEQTCIAAPSQWLATNAAGDRLYLRYRHGRGRVEFGDGTTLEPQILTTWSDRGDSFITLETFMTKAGMALAADATVTTLDDDPDDDAAAATSPAAAGPVPFLEGGFAMYSTPDQGVVIAYKVKGSEENKQLMIPPFILTMAGQASGLDPAQIMDHLKSGDIGG